jgi:hypothetical protein
MVRKKNLIDPVVVSGEHKPEEQSPKDDYDKHSIEHKKDFK